MKYDITKPNGFKVGMYDLNKNADYNFQLNRLVNMDDISQSTHTKA